MPRLIGTETRTVGDGRPLRAHSSIRRAIRDVLISPRNGERVSVRPTCPRLSAVLTGLAVVGACAPAHAQRIENQVAVFAALDKVTARISRLEVPLGETRQFGALKVTARACYSRNPIEPPKTSTFAEIDETQLDGTEKRIFSGWMFAESPGLNAVEHPVFDVWLTACAQPRQVVGRQPAPGAAARPGQPPQTGGAAPPPPPPEDDFRRRRPPR